jgi:hypothetical protein
VCFQSASFFAKATSQQAQHSGFLDEAREARRRRKLHIGVFEWLT